MTIPAAAMEASNAKNDVVAGFFVLALAVFTTEVLRDRSCPPSLAVLIGASVGLITATKVTCLLMSVPLLAFAGVAIARMDGIRSWKPAVLILTMAAALDAGYMARNVAVFGDPIGQRFGMSNERHGPRALASNLLRSFGQNAGSPIDPLNRFLTAAVERAHGAMGVSMNDPRTTNPYSPKFAVDWRPREEDVVGAPVHAALAIACLVGLAFGFRREPLWRRLFCLLPFASLAAFALVVKWQVWNTRLHIPILMLLAATAAYQLQGERVIAWTAPFVAALAVATLTPSVLHQLREPLLGSIFSGADLRFRDHPELVKRVDEIADYVRRLGPRTVGIAGAAWHQEYLVQRAILDRVSPSPRFLTLDPIVIPRGYVSPPPPDVAVLLHPDRAAGRALTLAFTYRNEREVALPTDLRRCVGTDFYTLLSADCAPICLDAPEILHAVYSRSEESR